MMRYLLGILFAFAALSVAQGQDSDEEIIYGAQAHSIGLNATGLILDLTNSDSSDHMNPFLIQYTWDMGKMNLRAAIGPEFRSSKEVHEGFTDSEEQTLFRLDARVGLGWDVLQENRWKVSIGGDIVGGYLTDKNTLDTGFDAVSKETERWSIGAGPYVQLVFFLAPRISIATETGLYFRSFETTTTERFKNFPEFDNQISKTTGTELDFILPTALFIQFHF